MAKQVDAIRAALSDAFLGEFSISVRVALCFVGAEWSLFAKPFDLGGVWIGWPKASTRIFVGREDSRRSSWRLSQGRGVSLLTS
jgi:hypothetical protein